MSKIVEIFRSQVEKCLPVFQNLLTTGDLMSYENELQRMLTNVSNTILNITSGMEKKI